MHLHHDESPCETKPLLETYGLFITFGNGYPLGFRSCAPEAILGRGTSAFHPLLCLYMLLLRIGNRFLQRDHHSGDTVTDFSGFTFRHIGDEVVSFFQTFHSFFKGKLREKILKVGLPRQVMDIELFPQLSNTVYFVSGYCCNLHFL